MNIRHHVGHLTAGLAAGLVLCAGSSAEITLYAQAPLPGTMDVGLGFYSSSIPRLTRNYKHADDFTVPGGGTITRVRWWGLSEGLAYKNLTNVDQFHIELYRSVAGPGGISMGELVLQADFALADTNQTATGRLNRRNQSIEYRHEVTLPSALVAEPGVTYFLSIAARPKDIKRDAWGWQDGAYVNGASQNWSWESQTWSSFQDTDSSFELIGTVPAPGTVSGAAVLLLGIRRRRAGTRRL
jgi:hypothetical protein